MAKANRLEAKDTYDASEMGAITEPDLIGSCSACGRAAAVGEAGWVWESFLTEPGYFFTAGTGSDRFFCPECWSSCGGRLGREVVTYPLDDETRSAID